MQYQMVKELYPYCRSITGDGVRATLRAIGKKIDLQIHEVPTGTKVLDWQIPKEWNIRDAYIKDPEGRKIVDFNKSNLHVLNYSAPVNTKVSLEELKQHLYSIPEKPDLIPYRTSYYKEAWGFCLTHNQLESLKPGIYEVFIDATLKDGALTYGECFIPGASDTEVLLSAHVCHPSLANDNLSGIALLSYLARYLGEHALRYSYRILFAPGTIGSITWLARNAEKVPRIRHGLIVSCVGDGGGPTYKRSRQGNAEIDQAVEYVLGRQFSSPVVQDFSPYGYDERNYCSPGYNLAVGLLERSKYGEFPEYHTSADNLEFVRPEYLEQSYRAVVEIVNIIESNRRYRNLMPHGEPQLGKRGLYDQTGGANEKKDRQMAVLWVLNQSDGSMSLLDIARKSGLPFQYISDAASQIQAAGLAEEVADVRL